MFSRNEFYLCAIACYTPLVTNGTMNARCRNKAMVMNHMGLRQYYSERRGLRSGKYDILTLRKMFRAFIAELEAKDFLYQLLGYHCVDGDDVPGKYGPVDAYVLREVGRDDLWPPDVRANAWTEDAIFDLMEFLAHHVSVGVEETGRYHGYNGCGWHYRDFVREPALDFFVPAANNILGRYDGGFELNDKLEVVALPPPGMEYLLDGKLPKSVSATNSIKVENAIRKYRSRTSSASDRADAVRDLGDVLEYFRPQIEKMLGKKDEADIFNFLNNFGVRHHNRKQRTDFDPIWLSGMFYHFLTMIHIVTRLRDQQSGNII